ncbi:MAG: hypothetical protein Q8K05_14820 [Polaromonas sp.]|nr:hypothetical protein [Polaromonas sp.]MDP3707837.1 hypothetical protein [Polaromonas sp.]
MQKPLQPTSRYRHSLELGLLTCNPALPVVQAARFAPADAARAHALVNALADIELTIVNPGRIFHTTALGSNPYGLEAYLA